jgi:hypothetical protein
MIRYCVAFCAVCIGGLTAAADMVVSLPLLPPHQPGIARRRSPEEDRLIFDACVTFYGIVYTTGRLLYRWWGAKPEAEQLRRWSRYHMVLLNLLGGSWLIFSSWQALQQAVVVRPSLVVGAVLLTLAAYDGWNGSRPAPLAK